MVKTVNYVLSVERDLYRFCDLENRLERLLLRRKPTKITIQKEKERPGTGEHSADWTPHATYLFCYDTQGTILFDYQNYNMPIFRIKLVPSSQGKELVKSLDELMKEYHFNKITVVENW